MTFKIWLTTDAVKRLEGNEPKFHGEKVETSKASSGSYITLYLDLVDPTIDLPRFDHRYIKAVTFSSQYYEGFRPEGMYRHKGGKAMVRTTVRVKTPYCGNQQDATSIERYQEISISAKSIRTAREIYTLIRQRELNPVEHWSDGGEEGVKILERDMK